MLKTSNGTPIELRNFTEVVIAGDYGLDAVLEYRKMKVADLIVETIRFNKEVNLKKENSIKRKKRIAELKLNIEMRKTVSEQV